jgi:hypothetical protein
MEELSIVHQIIRVLWKTSFELQLVTMFVRVTEVTSLNELRIRRRMFPYMSILYDNKAWAKGCITNTVAIETKYDSNRL